MPAMYEIRDVTLSAIDANPHRDLATFPWVERKISLLRQSIKEVGFWAGVIARPKGNRFEIAFGHHRIEAGKRNLLRTVPLIVQSLSDEQMLQYMGRENGEDYNADFLVMLNTWEAATRFLSAEPRKNHEPIEKARFLGWTEIRGESKTPQMNHTARACHYASSLIDGGWFPRERYAGLTVSDVEDLCGAEYNRMQQAAKVGKLNNASANEIAHAQKQIAKAALKTADDLKKGDIARRDTRAQLDINTYRFARDAKVKAPFFAAFGKTLVDQIERMLNTDATADKLNEVRKALPDIVENEDRQVVQKLDLALEQLGDRASDWRKKLTPNSKKIVSLATLGKGA